MIPAIRREKILTLLESGDIVYTDTLLAATGVSLSTLRRDLKELEKEQKIVQMHGGGVQLSQKSIELEISSKLNLNKNAKLKIAKAAADLVEDNDVLFLDSSSTTLPMIPYLRDKNITVVTNGLHHISQLYANSIPSVMIGGTIKMSTGSCIGHTAEITLRELNFTKCFLGANGFSLQTGITNHDINEKHIKKTAMSNSQKCYFLLDSSKFNVVTLSKVADLSEAAIITETFIPDLEGQADIINADNIDEQI